MPHPLSLRSSSRPHGVSALVPTLVAAAASFLLPCVGFAVEPGPQAPAWSKVKERGGLALFDRAREGDALREFVVRGEVEAPAEALVATLQDLESFPTWLPGCGRARLVRAGDAKESNATSRIYLYLEAPWPFSDRDLELEVRNGRDEAKGTWEYESTAVPVQGAVNKPRDGVVRIVRSTGRWVFRKLDEGRTAVEYQWHSDPAGNLPSWLANRVVHEAPLRTVENLVKRSLCVRSKSPSDPACVLE